MEWQGELRRGERGVHRSGRFGEYRTVRDGTGAERIVMAGEERKGVDRNGGERTGVE